MKNLSTFLILMFALLQPAFAGNDMRGHHIDRLIKDLQLDDKQEPVVRKILNSQHTKMRKEIQAIHQQVKPKMEALLEDTRQQLSAVLDDEQMQTFNHNVEKRREKMRERRSRWRNHDNEDTKS